MTATVHLLAAPFPTPQGTQASVAAFVRAARSRGRAHALLVPDESHGEVPEDLPIERLPRTRFRIGARSGPSLARALSDVAALVSLRRIVGARRLVAHNVEAAFLAAAARIPYVYVAHTSMRDELPMYGEGTEVAKSRLGALLDRVSVVRARATLAITPTLARTLAERFGRRVTYLPQPWPAASPVDARIRTARRRELGLDDRLVALHAGNLDRYQGLDAVALALGELARTRPVTFLLATSSDAREVKARMADLDVRTLALAAEDDRILAHAVADVVVLARAPTMGLPIKMLEAFARDVPVVATRASIAGLAVDDFVAITTDDPRSIARAIPIAASRAREATPLAREYLDRMHSAMESTAVLEGAFAAHAETPPGTRAKRRFP